MVVVGAGTYFLVLIFNIRSFFLGEMRESTLDLFVCLTIQCE